MDREHLKLVDRGRLVRRVRGGLVEIGTLKDWNCAYTYVRFGWAWFSVAVNDFEIEFIDDMEDPFRISSWSTDEFARRRYESMCRSIKRPT